MKKRRQMDWVIGSLRTLAALGIITAEIARKKCTVRRDSKQS